MSTVQKLGPDERQVLAKAVFSAADKLGLKRKDLEVVLGRNRSGLTRDGLDPSSKAGELALLLIRAYRALYALVGGDEAAMQHWFATENRHLAGVPREKVQRVDGLVQVVGYLDAMRGKV